MKKQKKYYRSNAVIYIQTLYDDKTKKHEIQVTHKTVMDSWIRNYRRWYKDYKFTLVKTEYGYYLDK